MRAPNPSSGPAHRPLGTRRTALATLSPGPATRARVLQTGGRDLLGGQDFQKVGKQGSKKAGKQGSWPEGKLEQGRTCY